MEWISNEFLEKEARKLSKAILSRDEEYNNASSDRKKQMEEVEFENAKLQIKYTLRFTMGMAEIGLPKEIWMIVMKGVFPPYSGILLNPLTKKTVWVQDVRIEIRVSERQQPEVCINGQSSAAFFMRYKTPENPQV